MITLDTLTLAAFMEHAFYYKDPKDPNRWQRRLELPVALNCGSVYVTINQTPDMVCVEMPFTGLEPSGAVVMARAIVEAESALKALERMTGGEN